MNDTTATAAGVATTVGTFLASFPLAAVNQVLTAVSLVISIVVGILTARRIHRSLQEKGD